MGSKKTYKTYSMSTSVREIERVPELMRTIIELENKELNSIINSNEKEEYASRIIANGFVTSSKVDKDITDKIQDGQKLSDAEVKRYKIQAPQKVG